MNDNQVAAILAMCCFVCAVIVITAIISSF